MAERGHQVILCDLSAQMIDRAKQAAEAKGVSDNMQFIHCAAQDVASHLEQDFPRRVCSRRRQRGNRTRKSRPHDAGQTGSEGIGKQGGERDISDQPAYAAGLCRTGKHGFGGCAPERPLNACRHPHDDRVHHRNLEQLRDEAFEDAFERRQRKLAGFEEIFPHIQRSRLNAGKQACKGAFGLARRIRRFGCQSCAFLCAEYGESFGRDQPCLEQRRYFLLQYLWDRAYA